MPQVIHDEELQKVYCTLIRETNCDYGSIPDWVVDVPNLFFEKATYEDRQFWSMFNDGAELGMWAAQTGNNIFVLSDDELAHCACYILCFVAKSADEVKEKLIKAANEFLAKEKAELEAHTNE